MVLGAGLEPAARAGVRQIYGRYRNIPKCLNSFGKSRTFCPSSPRVSYALAFVAYRWSDRWSGLVVGIGLRVRLSRSGRERKETTRARPSKVAKEKRA